MKTKRFRRMAALAAVAVMCMAIPGLGAAASSLIGGNVAIAPANIIISSTENYLAYSSGSVLTCYGFTEVPYGYTAYVKVELQQYDGGWTTIKTWTAQGGSGATVDKLYAVDTDYDYRLKLTHKAYNSSGALIETITKYSNIV